MRIPDAVIREIADKTDMLEVVGKYVRLDKKGGRYWALCPFHHEKTPSFSVSPDKQLYYCFGCQAKGTLFTFVQEMEKLTFVESVRMLAEKAGVNIPRDDVSPEEDRKRTALLELNGRVAGSFAHILLATERGEKARRYLESRAVRPELVELFGLGYAGADRQWLFKFLTQKSYSQEFLAESGLFHARTEPDGTLAAFFRDRLMFPIRSPRGETLGFGGRAFDPSAPKYLNTPETPFFRKGETLYGLHQALDAVKREGSFIVVEGYMDVIAMHQAGLGTAVAPLGTALTERQARLLARYARRGVLCFDSDEAGRRATGRAVELLETAGLECRVMTVSGGKDPADLVQAGKPEALHAALQAAPSAFEHLLAQARAANDAGRPEGKQRIVEALRPYLATVGSPVRRDSYITMVADILDVGVNSVLDELGRGARPGRQASPSGSGGEARGIPARLSDELYLMVAVAANRDYFGDVRKSISLDDLTDESARVVYVALEECFRNAEDSLDAFVRRLGDERLELVLMSRLASEEFGMNASEVIGDGIRKLRARALERRGKTINARLVALGGQEASELRELLEEKMYVDRQLQEMKGAGDA